MNALELSLNPGHYGAIVDEDTVAVIDNVCNFLICARLSEDQDVRMLVHPAHGVWGYVCDIFEEGEIGSPLSPCIGWVNEESIPQNVREKLEIGRQSVLACEFDDLNDLE